MKLQIRFTEGIDAEKLKSKVTPVHPIVMLPSDRSRELERRVKGIALGMNRSYGLDPEDLFQEGMAGVCKRFKIGDTVGGMITQARFAMREFVREEFAERHAQKEAAKICHATWATSRTFEQLEDCLSKLPPFEGRVMRMWLGGQTPTGIGRKVGHHGKVVKNAIGRASGLMARSLGKTVNVEHLWPAINRGLPRGVYFKYGKFVARLGRQYLGTFNTCEEAAKARVSATSRQLFTERKRKQ